MRATPFAPTGAGSRVDHLTGQYHLHPGRQPGISGGRPVLDAGVLTRLLNGKPMADVPRQLGILFTLCAHAHRRTAALTLAAALQTDVAGQARQSSLQLRLETARDHLRSIALEWVAENTGEHPGAADLAWLQDCPLRLVAKPDAMDDALTFENLSRLKTWLQDRVLGEPLNAWLDSHQSPESLAGWCHTQASRLPPAHYLSRSAAFAAPTDQPTHDLELLNTDQTTQTSQLTDLAHALLLQPDFAQFPTWRGQCAENGPWARLRHRANRGQTQAPVHSLWTRLAARWVELIELANISPNSAVGAPLLSSGAIHLSPGQALGWCEMARGLLLHAVQLNAQGAVQDYRVLAPTEWNFHPQGTLARAVSALRLDDHSTALHLARAFDPCVGCTVEI